MYSSVFTYSKCIIKKYESKTDKDVNKMCINIIRFPTVFCFFQKYIKSNVLRTFVLRKQCVMYYELNRKIEKCH